MHADAQTLLDPTGRQQDNIRAAKIGKGETGAVAALPVFIEFMQEALKGMPVMDFRAPPGTKFANVGPNREAFRPGTEPGAQALPVSAPGVGAKPFAITPAAATAGPGLPAAPTPAATRCDTVSSPGSRRRRSISSPK